jgi:DNA-binding NtrC family response regulator
MLTGDDTQSAAINAIRAQAFDFLRKPVEGSRVADTVTRAFDHLEDLIETDRENDAILGEAEASSSASKRSRRCCVIARIWCRSS